MAYSPEERRLYDQLRYQKRLQDPVAAEKMKRRRKYKPRGAPPEWVTPTLSRAELVENWASRQPMPVPPPNVAQSEFLKPITLDQLRGRR